MLLDRLGKQNLVISFIFVRVSYLTTVEWKEFLPGSSLSHLDHGSRNNDLSLVSGICIVAITISMVLLPCAVSSTWTWVNQLLTLVQWLGWYRTTTYQNFNTLSHLGHLCGICYDIAEQYWAAWGLSESVVFHVVSWVSSWVVLVFWLGFGLFCFVFVLFWRHLAFCSHLFSNKRELPIKDKTFWWPSEPRARTAWAQKKCENGWSRTKRFDDRQSLERAQYELKKKW